MLALVAILARVGAHPRDVQGADSNDMIIRTLTCGCEGPVLDPMYPRTRGLALST